MVVNNRSSDAIISMRRLSLYGAVGQVKFPLNSTFAWQYFHDFFKQQFNSKPKHYVLSGRVGVRTGQIFRTKSPSKALLSPSDYSDSSKIAGKGIYSKYNIGFYTFYPLEVDQYEKANMKRIAGVKYLITF